MWSHLSMLLIRSDRLLIRLFFDAASGRLSRQLVDRLVTWWGAEVKLTPLILLIWKQRMCTRDMDIISTGYSGKTKEGRNYHVDKISLLFPVMDLLFCFPPLHLWPAEQHFQIFFTDYIWALFSYKCFVTWSCWLKTTSCNFKGVILILIALHLSFGKGLAPFKYLVSCIFLC